MTELCELCVKYHCDKCPQLKHPYTPYYYELFKDIRNKVRKVLEIGVGYKEIMNFPLKYHCGSSMYVWRDFFPKAKIYGIDIDDRCIFKDGRIQTFKCDQDSRDQLLKLLEKIGRDVDIVIDDGNHHHWSQSFTCQTLMPYLRDDVIYIIEDVRRASPRWWNIEGINFEVVHFDSGKRRDDHLVIARKDVKVIDNHSVKE